MTAPERIWTAPTKGRCHVGFDEPSMNYTIEYRRADLPPTLSAALELPEIKALVEALRAQRDMVCQDFALQAKVAADLDAALRAIEGQ